MIILEGVDSSGKSTLGRVIHERYGWPLIPSRGPAKSPEEIADRLREYDMMGPSMIFDRHPVISESIYGPLAGRPQSLQPIHYAKFWTGSHLLIYCRPPGDIRLAAQTNLAIDSPDYVAHLQTTRTQTIRAYDEFFEQLDHRRYLTFDWSNQTEVMVAVRRYVDAVSVLRRTHV